MDDTAQYSLYYETSKQHHIKYHPHAKSVGSNLQ